LASDDVGPSAEKVVAQTEASTGQARRIRSKSVLIAAAPFVLIVLVGGSPEVVVTAPLDRSPAWSAAQPAASVQQTAIAIAVAARCGPVCGPL